MMYNQHVMKIARAFAEIIIVCKTDKELENKIVSSGIFGDDAYFQDFRVDLYRLIEMTKEDV